MFPSSESGCGSQYNASCLALRCSSVLTLTCWAGQKHYRKISGKNWWRGEAEKQNDGAEDKPRCSVMEDRMCQEN
jgi:hypothetical protein